MKIVLRELRRGRASTIFAMGKTEDCQVLEFLQDLATNNEDEAGKIWALLDFTKDHGPPKNKDKCRFFKRERVFEFKTTGGVRIMAFWDDGKVIICSNGFLKKSQKTPKAQLARAATLRQEYFATRKAGHVIFDT